MINTIAKLLRETRRDQKKDLGDVAEATGISRPYLLAVERGNRIPSAETAMKILTGLGFPPVGMIYNRRTGGVVMEPLPLAVQHPTQNERILAKRGKR